MSNNVSCYWSLNKIKWNTKRFLVHDNIILFDLYIYILPHFSCSTQQETWMMSMISVVWRKKNRTAASFLQSMINDYKHARDRFWYTYHEHKKTICKALAALNTGLKFMDTDESEPYSRRKPNWGKLNFNIGFKF